MGKTSIQDIILVKAERKNRRYDKERGCYVYDVSFKTRAPLTERTLEVAEAFGLGVDDEHEHVLYRDFELKLAERDVVYITGDSGSGKSVLLRAIEEDLGDEAVNIDDIPVDTEQPLIDTFCESFHDALRLLSRVGLNDAFLFLREYDQLSEGQRYRYKIARMIAEGRKYWLADEFCSTLDRTTAKIVAYNIQKLSRRSGATLIVATTHTDLQEDLNPSILIHKGWGDQIHINYRKNTEAPYCTVYKEITLRFAKRQDYQQLAHLHYRNHNVPVPHRFYALERDDELVGVIAYSYPPINVSGRKNVVGYSPSIKELNRDWTIISRVIVHPKYRTIGLGQRLVAETLPICGRRHVELVAVMAQYNPFAEKAGMRLVSKTRPHHSVQRAVEQLREKGFNPAMTSSEGYNLNLLTDLNDTEVDNIREILLGVSSHYYRRLSRTGKPYVKKQQMSDWLWTQQRESLARSIRTLNILNQTKAYLYWCRDWLERKRIGGGG